MQISSDQVRNLFLKLRTYRTLASFPFEAKCLQLFLTSPQHHHNGFPWHKDFLKSTFFPKLYIFFHFSIVRRIVQTASDIFWWFSQIDSIVFLVNFLRENLHGGGYSICSFSMYYVLDDLKLWDPL